MPATSPAITMAVTITDGTTGSMFAGRGYTNTHTQQAHAQHSHPAHNTHTHIQPKYTHSGCVAFVLLALQRPSFSGMTVSGTIGTMG